MEWATFEAVVAGVAGPAGTRTRRAGGRRRPGTIAFMGLGEPLLHPRFLGHGAARQGARAARPRSRPTRCCWTTRWRPALLEAGLDQLVVSIDGASAEAFGRVRSGASLERVVENVRRLHDHRGPNYGPRCASGSSSWRCAPTSANCPACAGSPRSWARRSSSSATCSRTPRTCSTETLYDRQGSPSSGAHTTAGARWQLPAFDWDEELGAVAGQGADPLGPGLVPRRRPGGHA